jgi:hypothetical protein
MSEGKPPTWKVVPLLEALRQIPDDDEGSEEFQSVPKSTLPDRGANDGTENHVAIHDRPSDAARNTFPGCYEVPPIALSPSTQIVVREESVVDFESRSSEPDELGWTYTPDLQIGVLSPMEQHPNIEQESLGTEQRWNQVDPASLYDRDRGHVDPSSGDPVVIIASPAESPTISPLQRLINFLSGPWP